MGYGYLTIIPCEFPSGRGKSGSDVKSEHDVQHGKDVQSGQSDLKGNADPSLQSKNNEGEPKNERNLFIRISKNPKFLGYKLKEGETPYNLQFVKRLRKRINLPNMSEFEILRSDKHTIDLKVKFPSMYSRQGYKRSIKILEGEPMVIKVSQKEIPI